MSAWGCNCMGKNSLKYRSFFLLNILLCMGVLICVKLKIWILTWISDGGWWGHIFAANFVMQCDCACVCVCIQFCVYTCNLIFLSPLLFRAYEHRMRVIWYSRLKAKVQLKVKGASQNQLKKRKKKILALRYASFYLPPKKQKTT